ncbi:hypothetical protein ACIOMQ_36005 [Streptomyces sp. NPDC087845]|uniref:hypothetical protein n=1 Tax=Streptomyces sp. NPDC087845 TaxID=3365806 RepID=UPI0038215E11
MTGPAAQVGDGRASTSWLISMKAAFSHSMEEKAPPRRTPLTEALRIAHEVCDAAHGRTRDPRQQTRSWGVSALRPHWELVPARREGPSLTQLLKLNQYCRERAGQFGSMQVTGLTLEHDRRRSDALAQCRDSLWLSRDHRSLRDSRLSTRMRA